MPATDPSRAGASIPLVRLSGISKTFGATRALVDIDLAVNSHEVHALVGENGAGKSTCLSVIAGKVAPDAGHVRIGDDDLNPANPIVARRLGVAAIYQELTPFPALTVLENVFVGAMRANAGWIDKRQMRDRLTELTTRFDVHLDPDARVGALSIADQQLVEILRGVNTDARVLLFDEPTASLGVAERNALHDMIRTLKASGTAIALVSHDLDEVLQLADRVTVFRDGHIVTSRAASDWTKSDLIRHMLGKELQQLSALSDASDRQAAIGDALRVENLCVGDLISDINFTVRKGEVLGVAGLVGSGRTTLLSSLAGSHPRATGQVTLNGTTMRVPRRPVEAAKAGFVLLPEDRRGQGLFLALSASENIIAATMSKHGRFGFMSRRKVREATTNLAQDVEFRTDRLSQAARSFSGGNQQKLLIARAMDRQPKLLLADEPTRGIDVGAKAQILGQIRRLAQRGVSTMVVSSDLEELCAVCDRVLVLHEGRQVGILDRHEEALSPERILNLSFDLQENS